MIKMDKKLFDVIVLLKKVVLFTDDRVDRNSIPEGMYCYDIRHGDNVWFATLADHVGVNHAGSVICCEPFPPIKSCGVMRNTADGQPIRGRYNWVDEAKMTIAEYIERYSELRKKYCE